MVVIVSWLYDLEVGLVDIIMYFVDNLCMGMCVVFLIEYLFLLWFIMNILLEVLIKMDFIFFWKFCSLMVCGRMICWLDGMLIDFFIWFFRDVFRWGEVVIFNLVLFFEVI